MWRYLCKNILCSFTYIYIDKNGKVWLWFDWSSKSMERPELIVLETLFCFVCFVIYKLYTNANYCSTIGVHSPVPPLFFFFGRKRKTHALTHVTEYINFRIRVARKLWISYYSSNSSVVRESLWLSIRLRWLRLTASALL